METIILIAVIGSNGAFKSRGCPLHNSSPVYRDYFRNLTLGHNIVISIDTYNGLPDRSPPYSCRTTYVIGNPPADAETKSTRTVFLDTVDEAIAMARLSDKKTFFLADYDMYNAVCKPYKAAIKEILVAEVLEEYDSGLAWERPNVFEWNPVILEQVKPAGNEVGYTIFKYRALDVC